MIKTLCLTSIIAAILAGILSIVSVIFGVRDDDRVEQLLNSPGVIERFNKAKAGKTMPGAGSAGGGPLVKQAQAFASYLNPSQPKVQLPTRRGTTPSPRGSVAPKFTLLGTSFCATRPELSLAFIDEPGKGLRWVRQSSKVGHLIIEQIKDGLIVVRDGPKTFELKPEKKPQIGGTLLEGSPAGVYQRRPATGGSSSAGKARASITGGRLGRPQINAEQSAALEKLVDTLKNLQRDMKSDKADSDTSLKEKAALIEKLMSDYKAARVSAEEAKKLGDLGKELKGGRSAPGGSEAEDKKVSKIGKAGSS